MANNLVVQLLLKTGTFSTDLKQAKGQIQNFQKGCQTAGKSLDAFGKAIGVDIGALTKFGGVVGAAVVAGKTFKAVIDSNQKSADTFAGVMYAAKTAVGELAYAIGTFDFSNFQNGLGDLIRRARDAASAIDQLGNTLMSYNILQAKARAAVAHAKEVQKDPNATKEQKEAAVQAAKDAMAVLRSGTEVAMDDYTKTIISEANSRGAKLSGEGALAIMDKFFELDATKGRDAVKADAEAAFSAYQDALNKLNNDYTTTVMSQSIAGASWTSHLDNTNPEYIRRLDELNDQYKEAIVYNTMLVKMSDEELDKLGKQRVAMYGLEESLSTMGSQLETIDGRVNKVTGSTNRQIEAQKGSLEYWKQMVQQCTTMRDKQEIGSKGWNEWNTKLSIANDELERINNEMAKLIMAQTKLKHAEMSVALTPVTPIQGQVTTTTKPGLAGMGDKKSITELERDIEALEKARKNLQPGGTTNSLNNDDLIKGYNQRIAQKRAEIENIENMGLEVPKEAINTWETFGSTLSGVANIASSLSTIISSVVDDETAKKWEKFFNGVSSVVGVMQAMASIISTVTTLQKTFEEVTAATAAANAASAASEAEAVVAAKGAEAGAAAAAAGAEGASAVAGIPLVGPALAIAAAAAIVAAIIAAMATAKSAGKFANGGIVGGSSFTGDRLSASVNSGEMILNRSQQARLFEMANGGGGGGQVEFHISGTELVGVLNNQNRKNRIVR